MLLYSLLLFRCFVAPFHHHGYKRVQAHSSKNSIFALRYSEKVEDGISLSLLQNVEEDSKYLKVSITRWLDEEYISQDIHKVIGEKVATSYARLRASGVSDLGDFLILLGTELEKLNMREAFVNAWDVANKASDLLILRMDRELCSCSEDSAASRNLGTDSVKIDLDKFKEDLSIYRSSFERYAFLRKFLECMSCTSNISY